MTTRKYDSDSIQSLGYPDNVRHRPGMYIGALGNEGVFTILREILDNAVDESLEGRCTSLEVILEKDNTFTVIDDGRGIPAGVTKVVNAADGTTSKIPTLRAVFGVPHTSGKFNDESYKVSRGCFVGETKVLLADGSYETIENLNKRFSSSNRSPIYVRSLSTDDLSPSQGYVSNVQITKFTHELVTINFRQEVPGAPPVFKRVTCTPDHVFYVWVGSSVKGIQAAALKTSDLHVAFNGSGLIHLTTVSVSVFKSLTPIPVYDLTVEGTHTFFVGPGALVANSHGIGVKATNALSEILSVSSYHSNKWLTADFAKGKIQTDVRETKAPTHPLTGERQKSGTYVRFKPDLSILGSGASLSKSALFDWSRIAAYFTPNLTITLKALGSGGKVSERVFHFPEGPIRYVNDRISELSAKTEFGLLNDITFESSSKLHSCALKFTSYDGVDFCGFTNGLRNIEGGVHVQSALSALRDAIKPFAGKRQDFSLTELKDGVIGLINVKISGPQFDSQTKEKLVDARAGEPLYSVLLEDFKNFFKSNKKLAEALCERASKLKQLKTKFVASKQFLTALKKISKKGLPAKAATAPKCKPEDRELFLLEGDSACFAAGTMVLTVNGPTPIESLTSEWLGPVYTGHMDGVVNQTVCKFSPAFSVRTTDVLLKITFEDGNQYRCTPDHQWRLRLASNTNWCQAQDLVVGDCIVSASSLQPLKVSGIEIINLPDKSPVYDVTNLSGYERFSLSNGATVHNCGGLRFARFEDYQEFLPLKGKPPNMWRGKSADVTNEEILNIFAMLGFDPKHEDPLSKLRVGKIILMPDSDADGPLLGSTAVKMRDGSRRTIQSLAEDWKKSKESFELWSIDALGNQVPSEGRLPTIVDYVSTIVSITFDDGTIVCCTKNHKWPVADLDGRKPDRTVSGRSYLSTENLLVGDHIKSFNSTGHPEDRKIKSILHEYQDLVPVYCLNVPVHGNFLLESVNGGGIATGNSHIATLLCAIFMKFLPDLFDRGMVYMTRVPEYYAVDNKTVYYGDSTQELQSILKKASSKALINHLKGYGEAPSELLRVFACDPETRLLRKIMPSTDDKFSLLMANDSTSRKLLLGI